MGFLGFGNYNKPGPGVSKDEPQKAAPVRFFEIFLRKFWKFLQANLLFAIPAAVAAVLVVLLYIVGPLQYGFQIGTVGIRSLNLIFFCPLPFIFLSPFTAGLTFISRNFSREEHAFVWTDFIKAVKGNVKYFLINGVICYLVFVVMSFSLTYYYGMLNTGWFYYLPMALCLAFVLLFLFAQYYLPVMFVTFELTFKQAYKNAFIFSALGIGRNILLTALTIGFFVGFWFMISNFLLIIVLLLLFVFILFAFYNYLITFTVYPVIDKYLIQPYQNQENGVEVAEKELPTENGLFDFPVEDEDEEDGYVYINGRMVKKSEIKDQ